MRLIISTSFWMGLLLSAAGVLIVGSGLIYWGPSMQRDVPVPLLVLTLGSVPFLLWTSLLGHVLLGQERTRAFALQSVIQALALLGAQGAAYLLAQGQVEVAVVGWLVAQVTPALYAMLVLRKDFAIRPAIDWAFFRKAVRFGSAAYVGGWILFLNLRLDQFLVQAWLGSAGLGQYAVAVSLTEALGQLPVSISSVLFARVAATAGESAGSTARVCRLTVLTMSILAGGALVLAKPAILLLFGRSYESALPALYALLPGTVGLVLPSVIGGYLYGRGKPQYATYAAGGALVVTAVFDILLIPRYGIVGAGLASSLAYWVYGLGMTIIGQYTSQEAWYRFLIPVPADLHWARSLLKQQVSVIWERF